MIRFAAIPVLLMTAAGHAAGFDLGRAIREAAPGNVVTVPAGVYAGPFEIDREIVLEGAEGAVLQGLGEGDVVRITAPGVTLRGFRIRGTGTRIEQHNAGVAVTAAGALVSGNVLEDVLFGISLDRAPHCRIIGNRIRGMDLDIARRGDAVRLWSSDSVTVEDNDVADSRDIVIWYCRSTTVRGNHVARGRYGLHFMYAEGASLEDNRIEDCSVGAYLMYSHDIVVEHNEFTRSRGPSGFGLGLKDADRVEARSNSFVGNRVGIYLDNSPWSLGVYDHFEGNLLAFNDIGVTLLPAVKRNRFSGNAFVDNLEQVAVQGGGILTGNDFTYGGRGNYWSDYAGYDLGGDGAGDLPYRSASLFEDLMDRDRNLRLFLFSPAQQAVELAARSLPAIRPRPKMEDAAPLTTPPLLAVPQSAPAARWPFALLAALLGFGSVSAVRGVLKGRMRVAIAPPTPGPVEGGAPLIRIQGLRKRFGSFTALAGIDLQLRGGEAVALWGRNGAGKTTAIRCLLGLYRCEGSVCVAGLDIRVHGKQARRLIGYVPQELAFHDDLRARETLRFYAALKGVEPGRAESVLADVGMSAHADKRIRELSGGMKQRVALAAALLADPPILLLDEMTSNLDQAARAGFLRLLAGLKVGGKTILFTSHRLDEVQLLADRVLVLEGGHVRTQCTPSQLPTALGLVATIRVRVGRDSLTAAADALRALPLSLSVNGDDDIRVCVPFERKMDVFRALDRAGVPMGDFEIEAEGPLAVGDVGADSGREE